MERNEFIYKLYNQAIIKAKENKYEFSYPEQDELIHFIKKGVSRLSLSDFGSLARRQMVLTNLERLVESVTHQAVHTNHVNPVKFRDISIQIKVWPFYCIEDKQVKI